MTDSIKRGNIEIKEETLMAEQAASPMPVLLNPDISDKAKIFWILVNHTLDHFDPVPPKEAVCAALGIDFMGMMPIVTELIEHGYIEDKEDGFYFTIPPKHVKQYGFLSDVLQIVMENYGEETN